MSFENTNTRNVPSYSSFPHSVESTNRLLESSSDTVVKKSSISSTTPPTLSCKSTPEAPPVTPVTLTSVNSTVCRICHTNTPNENLISPCNCKGSLAYVHLSCLERWLNQSSRNYCELCMYHYNAIQTQRYGLWEGILMWTRHPRNRTHVQSDILISILLTIVTVGLVAVCLLGMQYFVIEGRKLGISRAWTKGAICFFLAIVVTGYVVTLYLLIKDQVVPWYNWWKNTVDVRLTLTPSVMEGNTIISRELTETSV
ncbi:hypothetical protein ILUMI_11116 [Ignelater luminosus]|uniref:RING-CH-type domain-containing protein n=1 Tax=Ignelater luminosus TaxID=2038154 RepID=A0A8K0CWU9_IGNLU|nr:hypothetical protein ILUMI_11116 [Ignelater luminosus]